MEKNKEKFTTRRIAYIGIFIAISVVVNTLRFGYFSFGGLPIILSGYALGPVSGFIVGGLADIIAFAVRPSASGGFNPLFSLTSALTGAIPVIVTRKLGGKYPDFSLPTLFAGIFVGQTLTSVIMVPFFISIIAGKNIFIPQLIKAASKQVTSIPLYSVIIKAIFKPIADVVKFEEV